MIYSDFQGLKLSLLGFGTMRLPQKDGAIDEARVAAMTEYAMAHGVNYFDTAYPYHGGNSERVMGRVLAKYPRESFYLATKYPGHQIMSKHDPKGIFEEQLEKCGVEYFDFYLLHNVCENSIATYEDPRWDIIGYFLEQKRLGRIRHLGFSTHSGTAFLEEFCAKYGKDMEFCQIQLNYVDETLQQAGEKVNILNKYGIPIWVMEPVRGGKLAKITDEQQAKLDAVTPGRTPAQWAFRWLQGVNGVSVVLSGMSDEAQMEDNCATFDAPASLSGEETAALAALAEEMKAAVPCTACRYCCDGCPMGLDIPNLLAMYNDLRYVASFNVGMRIDALPDEKKPSACVNCGRCSAICPQHIDIPAALADFTDRLAKTPSWAAICKEREEAAKKKG